jgi:hypothetical protein
MSLPFAQALTLLQQWHDDHSWVYVQGSLKASSEEQLFWAQITQISQTEVCFAGDDNVLRIPLAECTFEHVGSNHIPRIVLKRFKETDCCLFIRFHNGSALLYGRQSRVGFVNTFRPRTGTYA